ncbi:hypothetical protein K2173_004251 [Erythroxylum novogranatense]|uniref:BURP domain-containing protein n=1 Tax=Erythroxylum novogranatense TaxID=1862640 RepID=A0AAV8TRE2_9ROSI|nr:hypothetical protein K2173_004251 [Erythroxylum novogranatense]
MLYPKFIWLAFLRLDLVLRESLAASPSQDYWRSVLPDTPMPKVLHELLPTVPTLDNNHTSLTNYTGLSYNQSAMSIGINLGGIGITLGLGGLVSVSWSPFSGPNITLLPPSSPGDDSLFSYKYAAIKTQPRSNTNISLFFKEKDMFPGKKFNLCFIKTTPKTKLIPRQIADLIPFSSTKFSEILKLFSVESNSTNADIMSRTIEECEAEGLEGEEKNCATSLEAQVDFSTSHLGKYVRVLTTEVDKYDKEQQEYIIGQGVKILGEKIVVCHAKNYIYPIYYCHNMHQAKAYMVSLIGADHNTLKAIAICHLDTSKWNPIHLAFQVLKVKPGTIPICHFLPESHIVWVAK